MYDVSNRASFEHLTNWFTELDTYAHPNVMKIIVGNKTDKDQVEGCIKFSYYKGRKVSRSEGEEFAKKSGTLFIETSAKTTTGVKDAFVELVRKV